MRAKREEWAGEGDRPLPCFLPERDLSPPDKRLLCRSERGDSQARSCQPAEQVAEAAPAGETTPGAVTLAHEHTEGAADVTGAAGPGNTPAPMTPAAENKEPTTRSAKQGTPTG